MLTTEWKEKFSIKVNLSLVHLNFNNNWTNWTMYMLYSVLDWEPTILLLTKENQHSKNCICVLPWNSIFFKLILIKELVDTSEKFKCNLEMVNVNLPQSAILFVFWKEKVSEVWQCLYLKFLVFLASFQKPKEI